MLHNMVASGRNVVCICSADREHLPCLLTSPWSVTFSRHPPAPLIELPPRLGPAQLLIISRRYYAPIGAEIPLRTDGRGAWQLVATRSGEGRSRRTWRCVRLRRRSSALRLTTTTSPGASIPLNPITHTPPKFKKSPFSQRSFDNALYKFTLYLLTPPSFSSLMFPFSPYLFPFCLRNSFLHSAPNPGRGPGWALYAPAVGPSL